MYNLVGISYLAAQASSSTVPSPLEFSYKALKNFSWKSLFFSIGLAFMAGALTCVIWRAGLIDSLQAAFVVNVGRGEAPLQSPQTWLGLLLIVVSSNSA